MSHLDARLDGNLSQQGDPLKAVLFYHLIYTFTEHTEDDSVKSCCTYPTTDTHTHTHTCLLCSDNNLQPQL